MTQRSTKGASKQRRDAINERISQIRDQLPVSEATRSRLSQLQVMALSNAFIAKSNFFAVYSFDNDDRSTGVSERIDFTKCLPGFLMMADVTGRLLYVSDNVSDYLGNSAVDMVTQMDSIYDVIDEQDRHVLRQAMTQHQKPLTPSSAASWMQDVLTEQCDSRTYNLSFTCRMNSSGRCIRSAAGQPVSKMSFERQKTMQVTGQFLRPRSLIFGAQMSQNPHLTTVFVALCTPHLSALTISKTPCSDLLETSEADTMVFRSVHEMDMKFIKIESNGEFHLGYNQSSICGKSWYETIHHEDIGEAQRKHLKLTSSHHIGETNVNQTLILRVQTSNGQFIWLHVIMRVDVNDDGDFTCNGAKISCTNHVIDEAQALFLRELEVERQAVIVDELQPFQSVHYPTFDSSADPNLLQLPAPVRRENERQNVTQQLKRKIYGHLQQSNDDGLRFKRACLGNELVADVSEAPMTLVSSMPSPPMQSGDYLGMMTGAGEFFGQSWSSSAHMTNAFNFSTTLPMTSATVGQAITVPDDILTPICSPAATGKLPSDADVTLSELEEFMMKCADDSSFFPEKLPVGKPNNVIVMQNKLPVQELNYSHCDSTTLNLPELDPRYIASFLGDFELPTPSTPGPAAALTSTFDFNNESHRQLQLTGGHVVAMGNQYQNVGQSVVTLPMTCQPHHQQLQQQQPMISSTIPAFSGHQQGGSAFESTFNQQLINDLLILGGDFLNGIGADDFSCNVDALRPMPGNYFQNITMSYN